MKTRIKLRFFNNEAFFGPGVADLLREIDRCGNVRSACEKCGFSYSKAWTILRRCEVELGYPVVVRQVGGQSGGAAHITDKGRALLEIYDEMSAEIEALANRRFKELMQDKGLEYECDGAK